jgi:hypothetical protein
MPFLQIFASDSAKKTGTTTRIVDGLGLAKPE